MAGHFSSKSNAEGTIYMSRPAKSLRSRPAVRLHSGVSFAAAFDNAPHAMALVGADGTLLHVNRALCHMLGFGCEELIDANVSVITHPDDLETEWEQRQRLARADIGRYELMQRYVPKHGGSVWVRLSVSATRHPSSELACFVLHAEAVPPPGYGADKTDDERLRRFSDAALSAMHEIGNTLTPLMVNTELIVEQARNQAISGFAKEIFKAARRIAFTLRRLRRADDASSPVAYLGEERMLDLRMVPPETRPADVRGETSPALLDSEDQQHQN